MAIDLTSVVAEKELTKPAVSELPGKASPAPSPGEGRLVSLDTFRGFIMFWIVGGAAVVVGLAALGPKFLYDAVTYELDHTTWVGLRFYDLIWPSFMLMVGVSIPLSYAKRSRTQTYPQMLGHALTRFAVLFLLGSLRESIHFNQPYWVELSSALQPIAVASLVAFLLVRKSERFQAAVGGLILVAYALILAFVPAPGVPAGSLDPGVNLVRYIDIMLLGRTFPVTDAWGTIICTLPTISTTILGMLIGEWLMSARSKESKMKMIAGAGFLCLAAGYALSPLIPIIMKIWTTSYGLVSMGWACLMFLLFYWAIDVRGYRKWTLSFVVIGCNAVFIYMFQSIVPLGRIVGIFTSGHVAPLVRTAGSVGHRQPHLLHAVIVFGVEWLLLFWMYRRKIFIKA
jgi:predicted acyltransferase